MEILRSFGEKAAYHRQRSKRIEALGDAVFAIVMTLLVLDVRVPMQGLNSEMDLWIVLGNVLPKILTFILSFVVVGQLWSVFINQFNYIRGSDRNEIVIAIFYLLFVSLIPFSTSFLSEHLWSRVAVGFYLLNIMLALLILTIHWVYSYNSGLVREELMKKVIVHRAIMRRARTAFACYSIIVGFCFISSYLALGAIILLQIVFTFTGFIELIQSAIHRNKIDNHIKGPRKL
jgi:uncharacterized membrane protein